MARYVDTIDLPLPVEAAFDYLADFSHTAEWDPGVTRAEALTRGAPRLGSRFRVTARFLGREVPLEYEITTCERPFRLVLTGGNETLRSIDEITFTPRGDGTRVAYEARLELTGVARLADPILHLGFQLAGRAAARGLRRRTSEPAPPELRRRTRRARGAALVGALLAALVATGDVRAAELAGVAFDEAHESQGVSLQLQGVGLLRYRTFFKGYVAALYLSADAAPESALADVPRRLEIEYFWAIPARVFADATLEGVERNVPPEAAARLRPALAQWNRLYRDVEPGDRYSLTYVPGAGTELALNGEPLGRLPGAEFSSALFAIWLGDRPLDDGLREALLTGAGLRSAVR